MTFLRCFIMYVYSVNAPRRESVRQSLANRGPSNPDRARTERGERLLTGHVGGQNGIETPLVRIADLTSRTDGGLVDEGALARDAERVEDEEGVVAQPGQEAGLPAEEAEGEEGVADDLGDGPGDEHGCVEVGREGDGGEGVDDAPDEEEARRYLHEGRQEGGADNAFGRGGVEVSTA